MNYGQIFDCDSANGPGMRVSLFVSGCTHHCKGCFNEDTWDFNYGQLYTLKTEDHIIRLMGRSYINGLTILGGEPMEPINQEFILPLIMRIRSLWHNNKNIWIYSGYTFEQLQNPNYRCYSKYTQDILKNIDTLVDGEFMLPLKDISLKFRGSSNQRIINVPESIKSSSIVLHSEIM